MNRPFFLLDEIRVSAQEEPGRVHLLFANIDLNFDPASARKVAAALIDQAAVAELEAMAGAGGSE